MELPFELGKDHKSDTKKNWKGKGLICSDEEIEEIYQQYIYSTNCEICGNEYKSRSDRQMDHEHSTGKFRNVCCRSCNQRRSDVKIRSDNTSGHKYIYERKNSRMKQGFIWVFQLNNEYKKSSVDLEKLIEFRDKWFDDHPDFHT